MFRIFKKIKSKLTTVYSLYPKSMNVTPHVCDTSVGNFGFSYRKTDEESDPYKEYSFIYKISPHLKFFLGCEYNIYYYRMVSVCGPMKQNEFGNWYTNHWYTGSQLIIKYKCVEFIIVFGIYDTDGCGTLGKYEYVIRIRNKNSNTQWIECILTNRKNGTFIEDGYMNLGELGAKMIKEVVPIIYNESKFKE